MNEFVSHIEHYLVRDTESETLSFHLKGTDADTTFEMDYSLFRLIH